MEVARFDVRNIAAGDSFSFDTVVSEDLLDQFASITGDVNPLHTDDDFAVQRGFKRRVVHGALIGGLVSRLIGVHLPGMNCLLVHMNLKYPSAAYPDETIRVSGTVEQVSVPANAVSLQVMVLSLATQSAVATGTVALTFTKEQ